MPSPPAHIAQAVKNEELARELEDNYQEYRDWIVTLLFYCGVHFIKCRLAELNETTSTHRKRKQKIRNVSGIDSGLYSYYRSLEDLSRKARYECAEIDATKIQYSKDDLEFIKSLLGYN